MRVVKRTILSLAIATALSCIGAACVCAQKNAPVQAKADAPIATLISPTDYRQYLPLATPTAVAVTDNFTAIADGKTIYIYEGKITEDTQGVYRVYAHNNAVSQLAFDKDNNLYFLSEFELYKLSASDLTAPVSATPMGVVCSGFVIDGNTLYYYAMSKNIIKCYDLNSGTSLQDVTLTAPLQEYSPLTIDTNGQLYYVSERDNTYTVYAMNVNAHTNNALITFKEPLKSITIANHLFGVVTKNGTFYTYSTYDLGDCNAEDITPITDTSLEEMDKGDYTAVYTYGDSVFTLCENALRQYSVTEVTFTDFEITSSSASPHRLNGANEVFLAENKLFIADDGNDRVSVYNTEEGVFETAISTALPEPHLASYKDTLLVASTQEAVLYDLSAAHYGEPLLTVSVDEVDRKIVGAACVYDRYYLLTNDNYTYTFTAHDGVWNYTKTKSSPKQGLYATAFTSDVFGSLYVTYNSGELYRFTEKELVSPSSTGTKVADGLQNTTEISVDYNGNLYALSNGTVTKYAQDGQTQSFTPDYGLVKDDNPKVISFAFGVDSPYTYFLYEGNYVVKSDELQIDTVKELEISEATRKIFDPNNRDFTLVEVQKDAILTELNVNALQGADTFPYIAFERCHTPFTALKIGEEGMYNIIAVESGTIDYKTYLVEAAACNPVEDYHIAYTETDKIGYVTNTVNLYKFPYVNPLLAVVEIPRGAVVTLLGEIHKLDRTYYEISYVDENGVYSKGFIPTSYVNLFDGTAPITETITYGDTTDDTDSVGRMLYILLGLGAIGILTDVLLLRKIKETEEG